MANAILYVDSTATGTGTGASWANAFTTMVAAIAASGTTGTDFYVYNGHVEGAVAATICTFKGVAATPDRVFSCGRTNSPPTTADLAVGASLNTSTGAFTINGYVYLYGCTIQAASTTGSCIIASAAVGHDVVLDNCKLVKTGAGGPNYFGPAGGAAQSVRVTLLNTTMRFSSAADTVHARAGTLRWLNTSSAIDAAGTLPTTLFSSSSLSATGVVICDGVDFSALTSKALNNTLSTASGAYQFANCKLPTGMTFGTPAAPGGPVLDLVNCDSGSTNYKQSRYMYQGTLTQSTSVYNNASDGATPLSWQIITTANANPQSPFECFDIVQWVAAGTYAASKIFATSATGALKTNDVWVDVQYMGASYPLGAPATTLGAGSGTATLPQIPQGTTPGSITTGATWGTGGLGTNYSLDVPSFTTSAAGWVRFRVKIGKPSLTINIDPEATIA